MRRAASQLPGRGPLMWILPLHVNKKFDYIYDDEVGHYGVPSILRYWLMIT